MYIALASLLAGALIGGWLCDKLGRKKIYQWDMLIYAAGMAMLVFAVAPWMIVTGFPVGQHSSFTV